MIDVNYSAPWHPTSVHVRVAYILERRGSDPFKPFSSMNTRERRLAASSKVKEMEAERREVHLVQCAQQGQVLRWEEKVIERKLSWTEIWNWSTLHLTFLVRSTYNVLPSPLNLVR